ncbi:NAD(P)-dependent dehydrogenase, short-chain alcohol dehydrogenase family [Amycolatopsis xylanica]|uniref:Probable oxidoreductase n=1 Tax=Amycolatopsis xylanica TaxID=589385 RepID=A0A1H3PBN4_9PSEU|nr:SDR family NAD(P)-dependent oxidoreductase [Amycolatopsis xylanica]SDY98468.1 NAD(P)-dependent dehydrogenase, short-chain alcohol dehydrogenase family [Amycolatopsis xylanica]
MTTAQHKIGSGFTDTSTATEVLHGIDLTGKLALVTGGYSGIGLETTKALAAAGAFVVAPARRRAVAEEALAGIENVEIDELDLGDPESIRTFADRFLATGRRIDMIITSAGVMASPESRVGPGWEAQFGINHLGHFALVNRLWEAVADGARIISVSSRGHHFSPIRWDDIEFTAGYDKWQAYGQAKTANILFAVQLDKFGRDRGIRAFSLHPGRIRTNLIRHLELREMVEAGFMDTEGNMVGDAKTPEQGAATQVWAATSPLLDGMGGLYLQDCDVAEPAPADGTIAGVRDYALDPTEAARLWVLSADRTGVNAFA